MKAPDKIYLQSCGDCPGVDSCQSCKFDDLEGVTWAKEKVWEKDVEYIRRDALLEWANGMARASATIGEEISYNELIEHIKSL